jgi:hypothetical protein
MAAMKITIKCIVFIEICIFYFIYIYLVSVSTDSITIGPVKPIKLCFGSHTDLMSNFLVFKTLVHLSKKKKHWSKLRDGQRKIISSRRDNNS